MGKRKGAGGSEECPPSTDGRSTFGRSSGWVFLGVSIVIVVVLGTAWVLLERSLPNYEGSITVGSGLTAPVEIYRDDYAIPHIYASSDRDAFFGLGYAHAQDRLWQVDLLRRTVQGRLSERFGDRTVRSDELLRRLDLYRAAERSVDAQSTYARDALEAYSAGINARIAETGGAGRAAPEFLLFGPPVEPWQPADSIAILKLLALQLASHVDREVRRARASLILPPERIYDILPDDPGAPRVDAPDYRALFPDLPAGSRQARSRDTPSLFGMTSNAWAISAERSTTGQPQMANDPHLDLSSPGIWYLARLSLSSGDVIGATIPGVPAILSGRTDVTAWGITAANVDDQDVVIERLDPLDSSRVLTPGGSTPLTRRQDEIRIKGGGPQPLLLEWTDNGPIIPGYFYDLETVTPPGHVAAIARTVFDHSDTSISATLDLMRAGSVREMLEAGKDFVAPAINLTAIDRDHIVLQVLGRLPRRDEGHLTLGRMPAPGWDEATSWKGYLPYRDNPRFLDPDEGFVANTNNRTVTRQFPYHVSFDWGDTERIVRARELLSGERQVSSSDLEEAQLDTLSLPAKRLIPLLLEHAGPATGLAGDVHELLRNWDGRMDADRAEPLLYASWIRALYDELTSGLGPLATSLTRVNPVFVTRVLEDVEGASIWCKGDCSQVVRDARDVMLNRKSISEEDLTDLQWGDEHVAVHKHLVLGDIPLLGALVNIRHPSSGGDDTLLRGLTIGKGPASFENVHASGYRALYDLASPEMSRFILSTGQSGHPLSPHYRDQNRLWREGRYLTMEMRDFQARIHPRHLLVVAPE